MFSKVLIPESVKIGYKSCLNIFVKMYTVVAVAWVCHYLIEYLGYSIKNFINVTAVSDGKFVPSQL
jgi:hypothetical protein